MRGINRFTLLSGRGGAPQIVAAPCKKVGEIRLRCEMPEERDRDGDARNLAACKIRLTDLRRAGEHAHGCKNRVDFSALLLCYPRDFIKIQYRQFLISLPFT